MMTQFIPVLVHSLKIFLSKKGMDTRELIVYYITTKKIQNDNVSWTENKSLLLLLLLLLASYQRYINYMVSNKEINDNAK